MWTGLALVLTLSLILAPLVIVDGVYAEPKIPNAILDSEKFKGNDKQLIPDQYIVVLKKGVSKDKVSNEHGLLKKNS